VEPLHLLRPPPLLPVATLVPRVDWQTCRAVGYAEVTVGATAATRDARTSSSLQREPAPLADWVRGKNTYRPFAPAGPATVGPDDDADDQQDGPGRSKDLAADWSAANGGVPLGAGAAAAAPAAAPVTAVSSFAAALLGLGDDDVFPLDAAGPATDVGPAPREVRGRVGSM
jgi:hypothetical protein